MKIKIVLKKAAIRCKDTSFKTVLINTIKSAVDVLVKVMSKDVGSENISLNVL